MSLFSKFPYDALNDFTQISLTASFEMLVAVSDASPYKSVRDVVDAARKNPGRLNLGAINPGSTQNLSAHLFQQVTGAEYTIVPYRTTPDLVTALLRGDVDVGFDFYAGFQAAIGPGKMRIIATASGPSRSVARSGAEAAGESGFAAICRCELERACDPRGCAGRRDPNSQRQHQSFARLAGYPAKGSQSGNRGDRQLATRDA